MSGLGGWSIRVLLVLPFLTGPSFQTDPPRVAGIGLGMSAQQVHRVLGGPDRREGSLGMRFWDYDRRGVTLFWREGESGVHGIVATSVAAGVVRGVRVGDSEVALRQQWGVPARARQDGRFQDFVGAGWVLSVELKGKQVVQITLMAADIAVH